MSVSVEFGFSSVGQEVTFNDISADVVSINTNRGKDPQQDTFNAATCSIELNNQTRKYDPDYSASPYQGQIVPTGQVRVYSDDQIIFTGFITDWNFKYTPAGESIAEIVAADAFWNLNNQALTDYAPVEQLSSQRIISVLSRPEVGGTAVWPDSKRLISTGVATVGDYAVSDGTNVLSYLQEVERAEPGRLFIDKSGSIVFRSRNNDLSNPSFEYTRVNLSPNPSFENNTRSWTVGTGTLTESTAQAYIGTQSASLSAGGVATQFFSSEFGVDYTTSVYAKASSGTVTLALSGLTSSDGSAYSEINPTTAQVGTAGWTRLHTSFTGSSNFAGMRIKQQPSSAAVFLDAILIEASPILDAYFDGDNDPVYNFANPDEPDYQPQRAFETYETEWVLE
jgi:hypothetical protein